jgi:ATP-dependent Clp protease ATP-binding subunit ClpC
MNYDNLKQKLLDEVKRVFRPEFLNRVDDTIVFHPLSRQDLEQIIHFELKEVQDRLKDKKMELVLTDEVLKFLIDQGYDPVFGARPLKRTIQRFVENVLAEEILGGKFEEGDKIRAEIRGERISFEKAT